METMINYDLNLVEAKFLLEVVGNLATHTRALPLFDKLLAQYQMQTANSLNVEDNTTLPADGVNN